MDQTKRKKSGIPAMTRLVTLVQDPSDLKKTGYDAMQGGK
jgi:hypothetical protein